MEPKKNKINHIIFIFFVYAVVSVQARSLSDTNVTKEITNSIDFSSNDDALDKVCLTPICIEDASRFLRNMDINVNPCDDFYKFACGGYINITEIPEDVYSVETNDKILDSISENIIMLLEEAIEPSEPEAFGIVKKMYKYCMRARSTETGKLDSLLSYIEQFGGWPVVKQNNWNESAFDWRGMNYKIGNKTFWMNFLFNFGYSRNSKDDTVKIHLYEPSLVHPPKILRDYKRKHEKKDLVKRYYDAMVYLADTMGTDNEFAKKIIKQALSFEANLAELLLPEEQDFSFQKSVLIEEMTLEELSKNYTFYPWKENLIKQFPLNITIDNNTKICLHNPTFIENFEKLINRTSNMKIASYVIFKEIHKHSTFINFGSESELSISKKICFNEVSELFPLIVGFLYARNYSDENVKEKTMTIAENVYNQFSEMLNTSEIMDDETKEISLSKLINLTFKISHEDEIFDDSILDEIYKDFEVIDDGYLNNRLRAVIFNEGTYWFSSVSTHNDFASDWIEFGKSLHILQTFYKPSINTIEIPAATLQGDYFNDDRPNYLNYGAIGSLIGHEITHGFDYSRRYYDNEGNLVDSWTQFAKQKYDEKAKCLIYQYGNYTVPKVNLNIDGAITLDENISDNGGIRAAYFAYKNTLIDQQPEVEKKLPKLDYTPSQLFWLSTANMWCENASRTSLSLNLAGDNHSPNEFRVNGMVSNSQEFANDFNCPIGSKMNPKNKCIVW